MRKVRILLFIGIWTAVLPYLGFPSLWKNILFSVTGLGLIYLSYTLYAEYKQKEGVEKVFDNFAENHNFQEKETL